MINELRNFPTSLGRYEIEQHFRAEPKPFWVWEHTAPIGWHESLFRSFQVLEKVKELLRLGTPPKVVLEIIEDAYATTPRAENQER